MLNVFLVFVGGGLGAAGRYWVGGAALKRLGPAFPYGTLIVNVAGSLLIGLLIAWLIYRDSAGHGNNAGLRLFLATGVLGGFTTFSAFSLDVVSMWERGELVQALVYAGSSVLLSILAVFCGLWLGRAVIG